MSLLLQFQVLAVVSTVLFTAMAASAPSAFEPNQYLDQKAYEDAQKAPKVEAIKQNVVHIDGRPYYKFGDGKASILVPKVDHLSAPDLERAICAEDLQDVCDPAKGSPGDPKRQELCDKQGLKEAMATSAQYALAKDTAVYLSLIVTTIQTTCGGIGRKPNVKRLESLFEVGLEKKNPDPRHPGSERIFVRPNLKSPLTPEVGAGVTF